MPDELERLILDSGGERAFPPGLRERIERAVLEWRSSPPSSPDHVVLAGVDAPRPIPDPVRARIEGNVSASDVSFYEGIDSARPLPGRVRESIEHALIPDRGVAASRVARTGGAGKVAAPLSRAVARRALGLVATLLLATGSLTVVLNDPTAPPTNEALPGTSQGGATSIGGGLDTLPRPAATVVPLVPLPPAAFGPVSGSGSSVSDQVGPPPPFSGFPAYAPAPSAPLTTGGSGPATEPSPPPARAPQPALRIGVVDGDASVSAGFRAYMKLVNEQGGIHGRALALNTTSMWTSAPLVTVNLSSVSIAGSRPSGTHGPLLDAMTTTESALHNDVFGMSSPPERQAHLIASAMSPPETQSRNAVIYTGSGVWQDVVPDAIEHVLDQRGVRTVARIPFDGDATIPVPADVAFLSLDTARARAWFRQIDESLYPMGVAGMYSLVDPAIAADMPAAGVRAISPYELPSDSPESRALREGTKVPVGSAVIHGWVTAKALAVALWQSNAKTQHRMTAALDALQGYSPGFMPAYEVRRGTRARTPEGLLYMVIDGRFARADTGWRRDGY